MVVGEKGGGGLKGERPNTVAPLVLHAWVTCHAGRGYLCDVVFKARHTS